jgi:hypothetical protein
MRIAVLLLVSMAVPTFARAASSRDVLELLQTAADALTNEDAGVFLDHFDHNMPQYSALRANVEGLLAAYQVESTVEIVSDEGDNEKRSLQLDWVLITEEKAVVRGAAATRRLILNCRIERRGKQWKITLLDPLDFFKY